MEPVLPVNRYIKFDASVEVTGDISGMTADEYLAWVRYQAENMPEVSKAEVNLEKYQNNQTKTMPDIAEIYSCPKEFEPDIIWENSVIYSFSELRVEMESLSCSANSRDRSIAVPQLRDEKSWKLFFSITTDLDMPEANSEEKEVDDTCSDGLEDIDDYCGFAETGTTQLDLGSQQPIDIQEDSIGDEALEDGVEVEEKSDDADEIVWTGNTDMKPTTRLLLQFDQVMTQRVLVYQIDWLEQCSCLNSHHAEWLYALLIRVEKPIHRDIEASIRQLYRRLCCLRYELWERTKHSPLDAIDHKASLCTNEVEEGEEVEDLPPLQTKNSAERLPDEDNSNKEVAVLNTLIAITGKYFGQGEHDRSRYLLTCATDFVKENEDNNGEDDGDDTEASDQWNGDSDEWVGSKRQHNDEEVDEEDEEVE